MVGEGPGEPGEREGKVLVLAGNAEPSRRAKALWECV